MPASPSRRRRHPATAYLDWLSRLVRCLPSSIRRRARSPGRTTDKGALFRLLLMLAADSAAGGTGQYCPLSERDARNHFSSPSVVVGKGREDIVRNRLALMGAVLVMSIAVACSNDDPVEQAPPPDPAPTTIVGTSGTQPPVQVVGAAVSGVGAGLSVADAIASTLEGPLLVNGFIFTEAGDVWLCDSLLRYEPLATDRVRKDRAECNEPRYRSLESTWQPSRASSSTKAPDGRTRLHRFWG